MTTKNPHNHPHFGRGLPLYPATAFPSGSSGRSSRRKPARRLQDFRLGRRRACAGCSVIARLRSKKGLR
jgi:hypothetical protein